MKCILPDNRLCDLMDQCFLLISDELLPILDDLHGGPEEHSLVANF